MQKRSTDTKVQPDQIEQIENLIDDVCDEVLNDEYAQLAHDMTVALSRMHPSPLERGGARGWACGIVYAIGQVNALSSKASSPCMTMATLCKAFGTSTVTGSSKAKTIRQLLGLRRFHPDWTLPSMMDHNPSFWRVEIDGVPTDARQLPRATQEALWHAGAIPYIPEQTTQHADAQATPQADPPEQAPQAELPKPSKPAQDEQEKPKAQRPKQRRPRRRKKKLPDSDVPHCGLCGKTHQLTRTPCCGQWICDDSHAYQPFSFARNSCMRNHDRYTLCAYHFREGHEGNWKACKACEGDFETENYVWYGTNDFNFEILENPPEYEPTRCATCGNIINLNEEGYSRKGNDYTCLQCMAP